MQKTKQISELNAFWCVDKHIPNITGCSLVLVAAHCSPPARSQFLCPFPRSAGSSQGDYTSCSLPAGRCSGLLPAHLSFCLPGTQYLPSNYPGSQKQKNAAAGLPMGHLFGLLLTHLQESLETCTIGQLQKAASALLGLESSAHKAPS